MANKRGKAASQRIRKRRVTSNDMGLSIGLLVDTAFGSLLAEVYDYEKLFIEKVPQ